MPRSSFLWRTLLVATLLFCLSAVAAAQGDPSKNVAVLPFESGVEAKPGFLDISRASVVAYLKDSKLFGSAAAADSSPADKTNVFELTAKLTEFKAGNMATRVMVGMGSGRASAAYEFTLKDAQSGKVLFHKTIKEKASVWSNNASSSAQRQELPDKIAATLVKELKVVRK